MQINIHYILIIVYWDPEEQPVTTTQLGGGMKGQMSLKKRDFCKIFYHKNMQFFCFRFPFSP